MTTKETVIGFNKWLFDNKMVPNSSFYWFQYEEKNSRFFKLDELYDIYISNNSIQNYMNEKEIRLKNQLNILTKTADENEQWRYM